MILRVAHLADSHLDEHNRLDDNVAVHRAFVAQAKQLNVNLILHAGDFFERRSTPAERNALADFLIGATEFAPVVGVRGNHDVPGDLDVFNHLYGRHSITIEDRPGQAYFGPDSERLCVFGLPWFDKRHLLAAYPEAAQGETTEAAIAAARQLLATMRADIEQAARDGYIPLVVGHVLVAGSEVSTGQTLIGQSVELAPGDLRDLGAAYCALGHIHKPQSWYDGRVAYSGSTQRNNFGEPEAKGWHLVTIDTERWRESDGVTVEFRELPARRIVLIERDLSPGVAAAPGWGDVSGALVRFRYRVRPEDLHACNVDGFEQSLREHGAHEVKLEPVIVHEARVRCAAIAEARSTWERVLAYLRSQYGPGILRPDDVRQIDRVEQKLAELERSRQEVAA